MSKTFHNLVPGFRIEAYGLHNLVLRCRTWFRDYRVLGAWVLRFRIETSSVKLSALATEPKRKGSGQGCKP